MASHVRDVADPKRRKVSVDAAATGNALMLYDILRRNGLSPGDYVIERAGGASRRWAALRSLRVKGNSRPS